MAPDATAWYAVILLAVGAVFWVWRSGTRQLEALRDLTRKLDRIGSRVLAAESRRAVADVLEQDLPGALGPVNWRLYFYERARRTLEAGVEIIPVHAPAEGEPAMIALAFRHRVPSRLRPPGTAETIHYLPCGLNDDTHGVLVVRGESLGEADAEALSHLANQVGAALAHLEARVGRELEARTEKRQAVGEVLNRVIGEIEQQGQFPALVDRLRAMMREEDRHLATHVDVAPVGPIRTTLLLEPDLNLRRGYLAALGDRGIRTLPATTVDEAADRLERVPFDLVFCSASLAQSGWLDIANRLGRRGRLVWLADSRSAHWVDGSGLPVITDVDGLAAVVAG